LKLPALELAHRLLTAAAAEFDDQRKFPAWYHCAMDLSGQRWVSPDAERETLRLIAGKDRRRLSMGAAR